MDIRPSVICTDLAGQEVLLALARRVGFENTTKRRFNNMQSTGGAQSEYKAAVVGLNGLQLDCRISHFLGVADPLYGAGFAASQ
jgi:hypothetical protein